MANDSNFWGLRPVKHLDGSPWNGVTEKCYISASYGTALYIGDPVKLGTTNGHEDPTGLYSHIEFAGLVYTSIIYGVIASFDDHVGCSKVYNPAATVRYANVCVDPSVIYHIRDDAGGTVADTWVHMNADMVAGTSSTITGLSGVGLDSTTPATTITMLLHIMRLANLPDNELANNAIWEVMLNTHHLRAGAAGQVTGVVRA